ncbi:MAG TPA: ABC transporter permease [Dehalococcoidia bacterium]|nr:ABC transporter permease [Dehalococcoidia bacterium]
MRRKPIAGASLIFLIAIMIVAIFAPVFATHDRFATATVDRLQGPSLSHYLGTDNLGRDTWSRLVYGARVSLIIGYTATALSLVVSTGIALVSGYFGGKVDLVVQRFVDGFLAVPALLITMAVVSIANPTVVNLILVIGIQFGISQSRVIRSSVLSIKNMPYVEAARATGASAPRIMLRHILPNIMAVVIVLASIAVARVILVEATLGFLGLGVPPPEPTWGQMLSGPARTFMTRAPWMGIAPGLAISFTVLAFNMLGDALRDVLDPRLRGSS